MQAEILKVSLTKKKPTKPIETSTTTNIVEIDAVMACNELKFYI